MARRQARGRWTELLADAIDEYYADTGEIDTPLVHFEEWLAEWGRDAGGGQHGLMPLTAHRAKDLEFDHVVVLDGGWDRPGAANENRGEEAPEGAGTGGSRATPGDEIPRKALAAGASRPRAVRRPNPQPLTPKPPGITPTKRATAHGPCGFCPPRAAAKPRDRLRRQKRARTRFLIGGRLLVTPASAPVQPILAASEREFWRTPGLFGVSARILAVTC